MNNELQRRLVATHNQVDPSMVTAEDLVRVIRNRTVIYFAVSLGWKGSQDPFTEMLAEHADAIEYIANLITLPEDKSQTVKLTTGAMVSYEQYRVVADYQSTEEDNNG